MEKQVAISILQDVAQSLTGDNGKQQGLSTVNQYLKGLEIAQNEKIQKLISKQMEYFNKYGEFDRRTLRMNKKVDEEMKKIFRS